MAHVPIPLKLPLGVDSDSSTFDTPAGAADVNNVRPFNGGWQTIGGWGSVESGLGGTVVAIHGHAFGTTPSLYMTYATRTALWQVLSFGTPVDITPSPAPSSADQWSLQSWGQTTLLALPKGGKLYEQTIASGNDATEVTEAPDASKWMLVTPERQVLLFGTSEVTSGDFNPLCIRGSDIEDYSSAGSWTPTSTNNALEHILPGGGEIVGAAMVGQYVGVWTSNTLFLGQFIGDPSQTYRFDPIGESAGLANPASVIVHRGVAYWVNERLELHQWTPGGLPEKIPCPISRDIADNKYIRAYFRCCVGAVQRYNEIWVLYRDARDGTGAGENTRYFAFCIDESRRSGRPIWYQGQIARTCISDNDLYGLSLSANIGSNVLMGDSSGNIQVHEYSGNAPTSSHIQSADYYLDDGRKRVTLHGIRPDFETQSGDVSLTLSCKNYPQGDVTTKGPHTLTAGADKKNFRASGKMIAAKFSGSDVAFRLGRPVFTASIGGDR